MDWLPLVVLIMECSRVWCSLTDMDWMAARLGMCVCVEVWYRWAGMGQTARVGGRVGLGC